MYIYKVHCIPFRLVVPQVLVVYTTTVVMLIGKTMHACMQTVIVHVHVQFLYAITINTILCVAM